MDSILPETVILPNGTNTYIFYVNGKTEWALSQVAIPVLIQKPSVELRQTYPTSRN